MITKHSAITNLKSNPASSSFLHMVREHLQHLHRPHQLHPRFQLHRRRSWPHCGIRRHLRRFRRHRERTDVEGGGHVLRPTSGDVSSGDVDESDGAGGGGEELEGAVVVREGVAVRVPNGDVLEEGEVCGAVAEREDREFHGVDGDLGV